MMLVTDEHESCINVFGLGVEPVLRAIMGIRAHRAQVLGTTVCTDEGYVRIDLEVERSVIVEFNRDFKRTVRIHRPLNHCGGLGTG